MTTASSSRFRLLWIKVPSPEPVWTDASA